MIVLSGFDAIPFFHKRHNVPEKFFGKPFRPVCNVAVFFFFPHHAIRRNNEHRPDFFFPDELIGDLGQFALVDPPQLILTVPVLQVQDRVAFRHFAITRRCINVAAFFLLADMSGIAFLADCTANRGGFPVCFVPGIRFPNACHLPGS